MATLLVRQGVVFKLTTLVRQSTLGPPPPLPPRGAESSLGTAAGACARRGFFVFVFVFVGVGVFCVCVFGCVECVFCVECVSVFVCPCLSLHAWLCVSVPFIRFLFFVFSVCFSVVLLFYHFFNRYYTGWFHKRGGRNFYYIFGRSFPSSIPSSIPPSIPSPVTDTAGGAGGGGEGGGGGSRSRASSPRSPTPEVGAAGAAESAGRCEEVTAALGVLAGLAEHEACVPLILESGDLGCLLQVTMMMVL